jgi:uncharacterized protein YdeI (YjbR/CyaY-like superfamily)
LAAYKAHSAITKNGEGRGGTERLGQHGKLTSMADLPPDEVLAGKITAAAERIAREGSAAKRPAKSSPKAEIAMPDDFAAALAGNARAQATYDGFPPGARRAYLEWITDAKRAETRARRIAQATEWLAQGKKRNWKYENC